MRIKFTLLGILACFVASSVLAEEGPASKEQNVGVGTGAVIGGIAGGPVGAILGAALGAKIGDRVSTRKKQVATLNDDLNGSRTRISELEQNIVSLNGNIETLGTDLEQMRTIARPELLSLMQAGIEMDLLFRTDEDVLKGATGERLNALAASLASMSDVHIKLDGYADQRGDATYNQELSARRVQHVRNLLIGNGVPDGRIQGDAHGESPTSDNHVDSLALERKVSLTLFIDQSPSFASTPVE